VAAHANHLGCDVDRQLVLRIGFDGRQERLGIARRNGHTRHAERDRVAKEDFRERFADHRPNTPALKGLRRVLARRATSEVAIDDQDAGAGVTRVRKRMHLAPFGQLLAIVLESVGLEPFEAHTLQEARRNDPIGIDVVAPQGHAAS
jgi:hypothetical protein